MWGIICISAHLCGPLWTSVDLHRPLRFAGHWVRLWKYTHPVGTVLVDGARSCVGKEGTEALPCETQR